MGGASREGMWFDSTHTDLLSYTDCSPAGGKAKPLKAPKKEKKEMDEDEIAFKAKQAAGESTPLRCIDECNADHT